MSETAPANLWGDALNEKAKKSVVTPAQYRSVLKWEVSASIATAAVLFGSALYVAGEAIVRLATSDTDESPDDQIMMGVAIASLCINV